MKSVVVLPARPDSPRTWSAIHAGALKHQADAIRAQGDQFLIGVRAA